MNQTHLKDKFEIKNRIPKSEWFQFDNSSLPDFEPDNNIEM